ncbi:MAG: hypothetical protein ACYCZA_08995 [Thiobacillus sp.]
MNRFLMLLMMLALPVQTFASAAMLDCAFSHQGPAAHQGLAMAADEMTIACHESKLPDNPATSHNCKHCAACYLTLALAIPHAAAASIAPVSQRVIPYADASFTGFIPDSPERPPRTSFA